MAYLIGTDEAGYGPNLGPLVISATVWEAPDGLSSEDLFRRLSHVITQEPNRVSADGGPRVAMADSKVLYTPGKGLRHLERGLWAALGLLDHRPRTWRDVWHALAPEALGGPMPLVPWYADYNGPAPLCCDGEEIEPLVEALRVGLAAADVRLAAVRSRAIFEEEFNELVERYGSKGAALSHQTLALAARLIEPLPARPISVICDKHGGRDHYERLLFDQFPECVIEIRGEGRSWSQYEFGPPGRRIEFRFQMQAECYLPTALASMASKYLRELAMRAWNDFWCSRVEGLAPTAGYPPDGRRFKQAIAAAQKELGIDDAVIWRTK